MSSTKAAALWLSGAVVAASALGFGAVQLVGNSNGNGTGNGNGGATGTTPGNAHPINLTGSVTGQPAPGVPATLTVTIDNSKNQAINVRTVSGSITSVRSAGMAGKPPCLASWYSLGSFTGTKYIAQGATGSVQIPLMLINLPTNQDNCKGQTVSFSFTASADQA